MSCLERVEQRVGLGDVLGLHRSPAARRAGRVGDADADVGPEQGLLEVVPGLVVDPRAPARPVKAPTKAPGPWPGGRASGAARRPPARRPPRRPRLRPGPTPPRPRPPARAPPRWGPWAARRHGAGRRRRLQLEAASAAAHHHHAEAEDHPDHEQDQQDHEFHGSTTLGRRPCHPKPSPRLWQGIRHR